MWNHNGIRQDWVAEPGIGLSVRPQTFFFAGYREKHELFQGIDFSKHSLRGGMFTGAFSKVNFSSDIDRGTEINFAPVNGQPPFLGNRTNLSASITLQPWKPLRIDNTYILSRLIARGSGASIFNNHIARMKINYQFTRRLSVRSIFQYETTLANSNLTSLKTTKRFSGDFLLTYLVNPGTALYIGYNDLRDNIDPRLLTVDGDLLRTRTSFLNTGRQFFFKFSYLVRF